METHVQLMAMSTVSIPWQWDLQTTEGNKPSMMRTVLLRLPSHIPSTPRLLMMSMPLNS